MPVKSLVEQWSISLPSDSVTPSSTKAAIASDGQYLYVHGPFGLLKVGSGYSNTKKVCMCPAIVVFVLLFKLLKILCYFGHRLSRDLCTRESQISSLARGVGWDTLRRSSSSFLLARVRTPSLFLIQKHSRLRQPLNLKVCKVHVRFALCELTHYYTFLPSACCS